MVGADSISQRGLFGSIDSAGRTHRGEPGHNVSVCAPNLGKASPRGSQMITTQFEYGRQEAARFAKFNVRLAIARTR